MPIKTLPEPQLQEMAATIVADTTAAFGITLVKNGVTAGQNFAADEPVRLELALTLLNDPDPDREIRFYSKTSMQPVFNGGATDGQAIVKNGTTFIYLNDGYQTSYLIIIQHGKVIQNLELEQQILSGPEVEQLIDRLLTQE